MCTVTLATHSSVGSTPSGGSVLALAWLVRVLGKIHYYYYYLEHVGAECARLAGVRG